MGGQHPLKGGYYPPPPPPPEQGGLGRLGGPGQQPPQKPVTPPPPTEPVTPPFIKCRLHQSINLDDSECRLHGVHQFQPIRTLHSGLVINKYHLIGAF